MWMAQFTSLLSKAIFRSATAGEPRLFPKGRRLRKKIRTKFKASCIKARAVVVMKRISLFFILWLAKSRRIAAAAIIIIMNAVTTSVPFVRSSYPRLARFCGLATPPIPHVALVVDQIFVRQMINRFRALFWRLGMWTRSLAWTS